MKEVDSITLIVVEPDFAIDPADETGLPKDAAELQGIADRIPLLRGRAKPRPVKLSALKDRMAAVQVEVGELLADLKPSTGGYRLSEIQVSLAISGSGSIGVATVGAEASISLTFAAPLD